MSYETVFDELKDLFGYYTSNIKDDYVDVETFIRNHKHINYCEIVMNKEGEVCYSKPSHINTLIRSTGKSEKEIYDIMPLDASPIDWLIEYTGYVAIYTNGIYLPNEVTEKQALALEKLFGENLVGRLIFNYSYDYNKVKELANSSDNLTLKRFFTKFLQI